MTILLISTIRRHCNNMNHYEIPWSESICRVSFLSWIMHYNRILYASEFVNRWISNTSKDTLDDWSPWKPADFDKWSYSTQTNQCFLSPIIGIDILFAPNHPVLWSSVSVSSGVRSMITTAPASPRKLWWNHVMATLCSLVSLREGNPLVTGFPHKGPVMRTFPISFWTSYWTDKLPVIWDAITLIRHRCNAMPFDENQSGLYIKPDRCVHHEHILDAACTWIHNF